MKKKRIYLIIITLLITINCVNVMAQQWGMYTFYAPQNTPQAKLVDTSGTVFKTWTLSSSTAYSAYLLPNDTILQTVKYQSGNIGQGGVTGKVRKVNWAGTTVWEYAVSNATTQMHHDICPMPNGNVLLICYESKSASPTTVGCSTTLTVWSEKIIEVHPTGSTTGTIVWEWHLWDHLCQSTYSNVTSTYVTNVSEHPERMNINYSIKQDWLHMNGIDYNPQLDQIMLSSHALNEIYVIDHSTTTAQAATHAGGNSGKGGDFLYRWGNPAAYGLSSTGNNSGFNVIHDAHWIPSTNPLYPNYMCAYNNNSGSNVKIAIWNPPYNGYNYTYTAGSIIGPTTVINPTIPSFTANDMGNSQQLGNGNELVCNPGGSIYEVSSSGTVLQTISNARSVHAYRYELCYVRAPIASASASSTQINSGTAVTLGASATSVTETNPTYSYEWSSTSGFTSTQQNPTVSPTTSAIYTLVVTNTAIGCSDTANVTINVNGSNILAVNATAVPANVCSGSTVQLNSAPSGGTSYTYQWTSSPAGFTSTLQNPTVVPLANTSYTVTVISGSDTAFGTTSVILYPNPVTPTISQSGITMTSSASSGNQWYFNGSIIQGAIGNTYIPTQVGSYQVQVTDANTCTAISAVYTPTVKILENNVLAQTITIYPNPTRNTINLSIPISINTFETQIIDIYGKLILKNVNQSSIDMSGLSNGIYFIEIKTNGKFVQRSKIILNK